MPMTAEMRRGIDQIRDYLYGGGYPDPVSNAEHLSFLFFFYLIEGIDRDNALRAKAAKRNHESIFAGEWELRNPLNEKWGSGFESSHSAFWFPQERFEIGFPQARSTPRTPRELVNVMIQDLTPNPIRSSAGLPNRSPPWDGRFMIRKSPFTVTT